MWAAFILAFVFVIAISDLWTRKIPNILTTGAMVVGLVFHTFHGSLLSAASAMVIGFAVAVVFFHVGAIAGGDVKLVAALGALLGLFRWATAMEVAVLVAGAIALVQVVRRRAVRQTVSNIGQIVSAYRYDGFRAHPYLNVRNEGAIRAPFGVAAAVGTVVAMLLA